jgi:hypothetical protein
VATIVTVHGTFAHVGSDAGAAAPAANAAASELWWWQPGSVFARDLQALVETAGGGPSVPVTIQPFVWSGDNSEVGRRVAGGKLLDQLLLLEQRGEPYCVVGHSHGGSVITAALLNSLARGVQLPNMQRWVTIGTPFVAMRPMAWLVDRLNLTQKVILVASLMLLFMFLANLIGSLFGGPAALAMRDGAGATVMGYGPWRLALGALMMSIPAFIISGIYRLSDRRRLFFYRKPTIAAARAAFGPRWVSLVHKDDEAVQGLRSLPKASFQLFDKAFAVQRLTMLAVIAMPLAYILVLKSPPAMTGIANVLRQTLYNTDPVRAKAFKAKRDGIRNRIARSSPFGKPTLPENSGERTQTRQMRDDLKKDYPDYNAIERTLRFNRDFMEQNGAPCANNQLCGGGRDFAINSNLLFHLITDDLTASIFNDDTTLGNWGVAIRVMIPLVLVPVVFVALSLLAMYLINLLAIAVSALAARLLNRVTLAEIKRAIYGNDTIGEVAIGGGPRPAWMATAPPYLPPEVGGRITEYANTATSASLAKFRNALSAIAMSDGQGDTSLVSNYLTWKELIHTAYFELPEFKHLLARALSEADGFRASATFAADPNYANTAGWLAALRGIEPGDQPTPAMRVSTGATAATTGALT